MDLIFSDGVGGPLSLMSEGSMFWLNAWPGPKGIA